MSTGATVVQYEARNWGGVLRILMEKLTEREAGVLEAEAIEAGPACRWRLAIDCSQVTFLPSAGVGVLVRLHQRCRQEGGGGGGVVVFGLNDQLLELVKLTGIHRMLKFVDDEDGAARVLSR